MNPAKPIPYRIIRMGLAQEPESPDASLVAPTEGPQLAP